MSKRSNLTNPHLMGPSIRLHLRQVLRNRLPMVFLLLLFFDYAVIHKVLLAHEEADEFASLRVFGWWSGLGAISPLAAALLRACAGTSGDRGGSGIHPRGHLRRPWRGDRVTPPGPGSAWRGNGAGCDGDPSIAVASRYV